MFALSLDAQDWVWEHSQSKGVARIVLLAIADKANGRDVSAYAGTAFLVRRANASESAVKAAVKTLRAAGELRVVPGRKGPLGETRYKLPKAVGHVRPKSDASRNEGGSDSNPGGQNPLPPTGIGSIPPGGSESDRGGIGFKPQGGTESDPQNAVHTDNAGERRGEGAREAATPRPAAPELHPLPPDWQPNDVMLRWAARDCPSVDLTHATAQFVSHYRSLGSRRESWPDAWQKWLRDDEQKAKTRTGGGQLVPFPAPGTRPSTTDARFQQALDAGDRLQAMLDARRQEPS